jgi:hypothetical protein
VKTPSEELKRIYTVAKAYINVLNKKGRAYTFDNKPYTEKELREDAEKLLEGLK